VTYITTDSKQQKVRREESFPESKKAIDFFNDSIKERRISTATGQQMEISQLEEEIVTTRLTKNLESTLDAIEQIHGDVFDSKENVSKFISDLSEEELFKLYNYGKKGNKATETTVVERSTGGETEKYQEQATQSPNQVEDNPIIQDDPKELRISEQKKETITPKPKVKPETKETVDFKTGRYKTTDGILVTIKKQPSDTKDTFTVETSKIASFKGEDGQDYLHAPKVKHLQISAYPKFIADLIERGGIEINNDLTPSNSTPLKEEKPIIADKKFKNTIEVSTKQETPVAKTIKTVNAKFNKQEAVKSDEIFKEQKKQLLDDLTIAEDILLGENKDKARAAEDEFIEKGAKPDYIDTLITNSYEHSDLTKLPKEVIPNFHYCF